MSKLFILILVAILQINCKDAPYVFQPHTTAFFKCLKTAGYDWITMYIKADSNKINVDYIQGIYNANNAGLKVDLLLFSCGGISPEQQAQMIIKNIIP